MGKSYQFKIFGMDCAEEVAILRKELGPIVGKEALQFDLLNAKMTVVSEKLPPDEIIKSVEKTGMRAELWRDEQLSALTHNLGFWAQHGRSALTLASGVFLAFGFAAHAAIAGGIEAALGVEGAGIAHKVPNTARVFYLISIISGCRYVFPKALFAARQLRPDMNLLMVVAVIGAVAIGEWFEAATVAFLFAVSLTLESWSIAKARRAISALLDLTPPVVHVRNLDSSESDVSPIELPVGATFRIRPGERVALDGEVTSGESDINQAPITGESVPVQKKVGDTVFAGTINGDGALEVRSTKAASDTTLAHIIRMVADAQSRRAPSEQWVERFARIYTPVILALATAVIVVPPLLFHDDLDEWVYRGLVLLVIGCPCALVISTPVSIVAALTAAARNGVLVKGGAYIEMPSRLRAIALDKTGTITEGLPKVVEVVAFSGHSETEVIARAAAISANSSHPLAGAIVEYAASRKVSIDPAANFQTIQGKGATALINGRHFWLGSHRFLEERQQETPDIHQKLNDMAVGGKTIVTLGNDQHVCGAIALADTIRPTSKVAIAAMHTAGIQEIVMLTGDNQATAEAIAKQAGIDQVNAELLPQDKVTAVETLLEKYGLVAMVGDGINDAPALARASMGIAMGAIGSDAAIETADVALMSDDLSKLAWLITHSRRTITVIAQNISFALIIKLVFVCLTLIGHTSLWSAIAADMGASLVVVFNGLRLLHVNVNHRL